MRAAASGGAFCSSQRYTARNHRTQQALPDAARTPVRPLGVFLGRLGHGGVRVSGGRCTFDAVAPTSACKVQISSSDPLLLLGDAGLGRAVNFVPGEQRPKSFLR